MSDDTFTRRFHGDRADLAKIGIEIRVLTGSDAADAAEAQLYLLKEEDFRLPEVDFTPAELTALSMALAALDGRFAYARPLRLALTAICHGRQDELAGQFDLLPVALAPDEDARKAGKQLARLEDAVARGRSVRFFYPGADPDAPVVERTVDPYSLFFIQGHWYVVGRDHLRDAVRTFRVTRIAGPVRFLTEKNRDFYVPADYDPAAYRARPALVARTRSTARPRSASATTWPGTSSGWLPTSSHFPRRTMPAPGSWCRTRTRTYCSRGWSALVVAASCSSRPSFAPRLLGGPAPGARQRTPARPTQPPAAGRRPAERQGRRRRRRAGVAKKVTPETRYKPIATEHLARAVALLHYLVDPSNGRP